MTIFFKLILSRLHFGTLVNPKSMWTFNKRRYRQTFAQKTSESLPFWQYTPWSRGISTPTIWQYLRAVVIKAIRKRCLLWKGKNEVLQFLWITSATIMLLPIFLTNAERAKAQCFHSIVRPIGHTSYSKVKAEKNPNKTFLPDKITCLNNRRCCDSVCTLYQDIWKGNHVPSAIPVSMAVPQICRFLSKCQKRWQGKNSAANQD